jgi:uncharacterized membrane protein YfhO
LLEQSLHRLVFEVDAPADGVLVVVEGYDAGWRATVDGEPAQVLRANLVFRAVEVSAGTHTIVLEYAPPGVRAAWWLWLVTMMGLVAVAVDELRTRRPADGRRDTDEATPTEDA